jgi:Tol biopolymer transport system component
MISRFDLIVAGVAVVLVLVIGLSVLLATPVERPLRLAYLKADEWGLYHLWIADPQIPASGEQITFTEYGVFDYDVSRDGRYIAYAARDFQTGISDIVLLDLLTGNEYPLTNCVMQNDDCTAPAFRPDTGLIAYERRSILGGANRIWLIDLTAEPVRTYPLFEDSQILGYGAHWSADGQQIALYDNANRGILIYDFAASEVSGESPLRYIPTGYGNVGVFSPDGRRMAFPEMLFDGRQARGYLQIAELDSGLFQPLTDPTEQANDQAAAWSPDGRYIAISRTYLDERFTRGAQIYLMDAESGAISPLIFDERYSNGLFSWSPDSRKLAIQRFPVLDEDGNVPTDASGTPEVWTYDLETRQLTRVDDDARDPIWVP